MICLTFGDLWSRLMYLVTFDYCWKKLWPLGTFGDLLWPWILQLEFLYQSLNLQLYFNVQNYIPKFQLIQLYICKYIYLYIYIYILEFTVATLLNSSPPLALRGGSAYNLYKWSREYCMQKNALLSAYLNYDPYLIVFDLHWPLMAYEVKMT